MSTLITYELIEDNIAFVTLNRPNVSNALSTQLLHELNNTVNKVKNDDAIRSVIITGAGEKAFCAGADLKERLGMSNDEVVATVRNIGDTISNIESIPVPVIAAINGVAFGGGLELALACDIRIATSKVKVGLTETSLAIIPGAGGTQRLARLIGTGQAKRLIYTASSIGAKEAYALGMVELVVEQNQLNAEAIQMAKQISENGPIAVRQAKRAINLGMQIDLHHALEIEHLSYLQTIQTEDRIEGLRAFSEKRKPKYQGK